MKKARQKKNSKPKPLCAPTSGTDQELRDALEKSIDPATAKALRKKFDWLRENDAFTARCKPPIVEWLKARQSFVMPRYFRKLVSRDDRCDVVEAVRSPQLHDRFHLGGALPTVAECERGLPAGARPHTRRSLDRCRVLRPARPPAPGPPKWS